jgi:hypothetical protein
VDDMVVELVSTSEGSPLEKIDGERLLINNQLFLELVEEFLSFCLFLKLIFMVFV